MDDRLPLLILGSGLLIMGVLGVIGLRTGWYSALWDRVVDQRRLQGSAGYPPGFDKRTFLRGVVVFQIVVGSILLGVYFLH
jgi:hypothetical protein